MILNKNQIIDVEILSLGINGEGIARVDGLTVFIKGGLVGERIRVKIILIKKSFAIAIIDKILVASKDRVVPRCSVYNKCGGCQLQHLKYEEQLKFKNRTIQETLNKVAGIDKDINDTVPSKHTYKYRNKLSMPIRETEDIVSIGFFAKGSHRVIDVKSCPLQFHEADKIIEIVYSFMLQYKIKGYDEKNGSGDIRHLIIRKIKNKLYITLVINCETLKQKDELNELFKTNFSDNYEFWINVNKTESNIIFGDKFVFIDGTREDKEIDGLKVEVHPNSFFQVNDYIKDKLYDDVCSKAGSGDIVIDAYSGAGILTAKLSKSFKTAYGIEIVQQAHDAAEKLKKVNNIPNMYNYLGDCSDVLAKLKIEPTLTVLDPPRTGCDRQVLESIKSSKRIIYISCSPPTLSRDLKILQDFGFEIDEITPYDMFPQTSHVETLACLTRKN